MSQFKIHILLSLFLILALFSTPVLAAADSPLFTITVKSAYLRGSPSQSAARTYSVFSNQTYSIVGRTADDLWFQLDYAGATRGTWSSAAFGTVKGKLANVPVVAESGGAAPTATLMPESGPAPAAVPARVLFVVTVKSAFGRGTPAPDGTRVQSIYKGQTYNVHARTADGQWLQIDVTGATESVWIQAGYGTVSGNLNAIPVAEAPAAPTPAPTSASSPVGADSSFGPANYPIVPVVSPHAREIYQRGLTLGNNPRAFSKVGDCQNVTPFFLAPFDNPADHRLGSQYAYLQSAITNFRGSFTRNSEAVRAGYNVASVLDPMWSNPKDCASKETPLECEFRVHRPSIVIVNMETWWSGAPAAGYEASLRQIVEFSINHGVVPILGTKADNVEKDGSINAAIVRVAQAYDVPVWNFWLAAQPLPNHGLIADGFHLTWGRAFFDNPANLQYAWTWRNLTALQALDAVWQAVK